jgi:DNA N-6-adenine-methyltransferase (Dam).
MLNNSLFTSNKQNWETPQKFFDELNNEFNFNHDICADANNAKCKNYTTENENALEIKWGGLGNIFCNPPYDTKIQNAIFKKAYEESQKENVGTIVLLVPARTDTTRWHNYVFGKAKVRFLKGRLKFEVNGIGSDPAPFPSALIIYQ